LNSSGIAARLGGLSPPDAHSFTKRTLLLLLLSTATALGQLSVTVSPVKATGNKAMVPVAMKNGFAETIESARAVCFLLDEQGKMVGQSTRWVIDASAQAGRDGKHGLAPGATNSFNFVVTGTKPSASTNLTAKVQFTRVVLEGGEVVDPKTAVQIQPVPK
jgi:hypothetical protein